jgi:chemotaxis protein histidine kinase CheA
VSHLGGSCTIHSEAGSGTIIAVDLPFTPQQSVNTSERDSHFVSG